MRKAQILGAAWNSESREIRQEYKKKSEDIKAAFLKENPDYQYKPRRACEKKRRARRTSPANPAPTPPAITEEQLEMDRAYAKAYYT